MMEYDENLSDEKFRNLIENKITFKYLLVLMNIETLSPFSYQNNNVLDLIMNNKNIIQKYYKFLNYFGSLEKLNKEALKFCNASNEISKKFLENFLNKLKYKNNYLYKNIRRPIHSQHAINDESIIFDLDKISNYKSYPHLLSKYIYKDIFLFVVV